MTVLRERLQKEAFTLACIYVVNDGVIFND